MMKRFEVQMQDYKWIDCEAPSEADLVKLSEEFPIPQGSLLNCMDSEHLPMCEFFEKSYIFLLRHFDAQAKPQDGTMQELTTKIIFFVGSDFVLTLHRIPLLCIQNKRENLQTDNLPMLALLKSLSMQTIKSFDIPLDKLDAKTDIIEKRVFGLKRRSILREGYLIKRKISSYRKVFKFTQDVLNKLHAHEELPTRDMLQLKEPLDKLTFYSDNMHEEISGLLNLHLSLMSQKTNEASYRTNEVMRVLTVFSIFFLPLNFIAGIYGMNFEHMPELKTDHGYYYVLAAMLAVVLSITYWIHRKGWLKKDEL